MTERAEQTTRTRGPSRRRRAARLGAWVVSSILTLALIGGLAVLSFTGRSVDLPVWVTDRIEARLNARLDRFRIELGRAAVVVGQDGVPRVRLRGVELSDAGGVPLAQLNDIGAAFDPVALSRGQVLPRRLRLAGAQATVRRRADGGFELSLGGGGQSFEGIGGLLDALDAAFAAPPFTGVERIEARDLTVTLEDARTARVWQVTGGTLLLERDADGLGVTVVAEVFNGTEDLARLQLSVATDSDNASAAISATVENAAAADIALQSPVLSVLRVLEAPISGAFRTTLDTTGAPEGFAGTLEIGSGAVHPTPATRPVAFDSAKAYFSYDPATQKIALSQLTGRSDFATFEAEGHAYLRETGPGGWPRALVGQLRADRLRASAEGVLAAPVSFASATADLRLRLDPFTLEIGQLVLSGANGRHIRADGSVTAAPEGWDVAVDLSAEAVSAARAKALWPLAVAPKTRDWLDRNIVSGEITDLEAALRLAPGQDRRLAASFAFRDAEVGFLKQMPPLTGAAGHASIAGNRFALTLDRGGVVLPGGGTVSAAGSTLTVPDTRQKPARGEFRLHTEGTLSATLELIDQPPLSAFRTGPPPEVGEGRAVLDTAFDLTFGRKLRENEITYATNGLLRDFASDTLAPGRSIRAEALEVEATPSAVLVSGDATLDGIPLTARWRQGLSPEERGSSTLRGTVELSPRALDALGVALPEGSVSGRGTGDVTLTLEKGAPPEVLLTSDLSGLRLSLPALDWAKPAGATGRLAVEATLGPTPEVGRLEVEGGGLSAVGRLDLAPGGGLEAARFGRVRIGDWLDAPVTLTPRGWGQPPAIALRGGTFDLRAAEFGEGGSGGGARGPIDIALDRLVITDGIALTDVRGEIDGGGAVSGVITGRVNGGAPVRATLVPSQRGTAIRVLSDDGGGVFRDAGIIRTVRGGAMDLILNPTGAPGTYDGRLRVTGTRMRDAPVMAELLSAVSVVGLLEQLDGQGIPFEEVHADFRLTPDRVVLYDSSAVGASLGISMDGVYDLRSKRMDMQGVVSPIYLVNRVGSVLTRRGEGLFGFNFTLRGPSASPSVGVNPLSILTPGMFREIFRRPPPERGAR